MAHEEPGVHRQAAVDAVEVLAEGAPVVRHGREQRLERHPLDARQHARDVVDLARLDRREREAAVAADDRGDAVQRRRGGGRIPEHLGVVVRVDVDEARRDDEAVGVDGARRGLVDLADRDDAPVAYADVSTAACRSGAVDDAATADEQVQHGIPLAK